MAQFRTYGNELLVLCLLGFLWCNELLLHIPDISAISLD
jgi:hypothetical protein